MDSCNRQFPEFSTIIHKMIKNYLNSRRKMKRSKEHSGLDSVDAHSASTEHKVKNNIKAEQILAKAIENESENAKRMRMGLEPISQCMPGRAKLPSGGNQVKPLSESYQEKPYSGDSNLEPPSGGNFLEPLLGGNQSKLPQGIIHLKPPLGGNQVKLSSKVDPAEPSSGVSHGEFNIVPSIESTHSVSNVLSRDELKSTGSIHQLVKGYRESAAFLLRYADELEHLLQIQPKKAKQFNEMF